jgi:murein DD-endopeptidase MepM/ murein hydrolase activator NlpD
LKSSEEENILKNLNYGNPVLKHLKDDIFFHLRVSRSGQELSKIKRIKFYKYKVGAKDNFFTIMAKTGQNPDTLANVNQLASVHDIYRGQILKIPNYRGIYYQANEKEAVEDISRRYKIPLVLLLKTNKVKPQKKGAYLFIPGGRLLSRERNYFTGRAFINPLPIGKISSKYGRRKHPFTRRNTFHTGIDIAAKTGTSVRASASGKIVYAGRHGAYGKLVIIKHKLGYHTYYGHLSRYNVRKNMTVKQGQVIGYVGDTGRSTGPHLHFELRRFGKTRSPRKIIAHR